MPMGQNPHEPTISLRLKAERGDGPPHDGGHICLLTTRSAYVASTSGRHHAVNGELSHFADLSARTTQYVMIVT